MKKKAWFFLQPYFLILLPLTAIFKEHPEINFIDFGLICLLLAVVIFLIHTVTSKISKDEERTSLALSVMSLSFLLSEFTGLPGTIVWLAGASLCFMLLFVPLNLKIKGFLSSSLIFPLSIIIAYNMVSAVMVKQHSGKEMYNLMHMRNIKIKKRSNFAHEKAITNIHELATNTRRINY